MYNPLTVLVNGTYDVLQLTKLQRDPRTIHYADGVRYVNWNLGHSRWVIRRFGWNKFVTQELFPGSLDPDHAQWWPNYELHLIGGGMTYYAMSEWYAYHRIAYPRLWSLVTVSLMHYGNEVV